MTATFKIDATDLTLQSWPILQRRMRSNATYLEGTGLHQSRRVRGLKNAIRRLEVMSRFLFMSPKVYPMRLSPVLKLSNQFITCRAWKEISLFIWQRLAGLT